MSTVDQVYSGNVQDQRGLSEDEGATGRCVATCAMTEAHYMLF
jgi:hypothetical protein